VLHLDQAFTHAHAAAAGAPHADAKLGPVDDDARLLGGDDEAAALAQRRHTAVHLAFEQRERLDAARSALTEHAQPRARQHVDLGARLGDQGGACTVARAQLTGGGELVRAGDRALRRAVGKPRERLLALGLDLHVRMQRAHLRHRRRTREEAAPGEQQRGRHGDHREGCLA
jgi:hypothetical protein